MGSSENNGLKPCPFCGGEVELIALDLQWHIHCYGCDVYVHFANDNLREEAITAWNKRAEDFKEPLRWRLDDEYGYRGLRCPKCGNEFECYFDDIDEIWNYCPHCGQRLLPPEKKQEEN